MQQLQKQLTGRERREIVCVKYIQGWLKAAQTSVSLDVEARPGVLPAACRHPACSLMLVEMRLQQQTSRQRRFSGWIAWKGGKGRVGVEEDKPVMFLNCGAEGGLKFPPRAQTYLGRALISVQPLTQGKSQCCLVPWALPGTVGSILLLP